MISIEAEQYFNELFAFEGDRSGPCTARVQRGWGPSSQAYEYTVHHAGTHRHAHPCLTVSKRRYYKEMLFLACTNLANLYAYHMLIEFSLLSDKRIASNKNNSFMFNC